MWSFLAEFTKNLDSTYTVVVMDEQGVNQPRRYEVHPKRILTTWGGSTLFVSLFMVSLVVFTPVRQLIPGYGTEAIRKAARVNDMRVAALSDSLRAQRKYIQHLRSLITGEVDSSSVSDITLPVAPDKRNPSSAPVKNVSAGDAHVQSAALKQPPGPAPRAIRTRTWHEAPSSQVALENLQLPMQPPVEGFPTRGFDARAGHFAVDIAVATGTPVRSVGDGYVILADWTQQGGYTVAVQHAGGFVSIYKHNERLLKRVGDHVRSRESIATSGNTGEITTGPHLHFEFWRNGLAQDPSQYFVGW
jgi:murein DD-endopeptidase MepM/ murein hydrolase activator NlpD